VGLLLKGVLDLVGGACLLIAASPVLAVLAIAIKADSDGPVFFRQERVGLHGRSFLVVKFRSMCSGAEEQLEQLREHNEINGHAFKLRDDPRITRLGRFGMLSAAR
jgi:lipopolysaccharide/colanic/teichoic acid biosynthesis glycosyltransferase